MGKSRNADMESVACIRGGMEGVEGGRSNVDVAEAVERCNMLHFQVLSRDPEILNRQRKESSQLAVVERSREEQIDSVYVQSCTTSSIESNATSLASA